MFGGSFAVQWGIGLVVDAARVAYGLDTAGGLRVAFAARRRVLRAVVRVVPARVEALRPHPSRHASRPDAMHLHILGICGTFMGGHRGHRARPPAIASPAATPTSIRRCARSSRRSASTLDRRLRRGAARGVARDADVVRHRQRRVARQSADGGDPRRAAGATSRDRSGCTRTCCTTAGCSRSPARTARRRRRRCSRGSSRTRA